MELGRDQDLDTIKYTSSRQSLQERVCVRARVCLGTSECDGALVIYCHLLSLSFL